MLSKVSVEEVFMHYFEKMSSAFGGRICPRPPPGLCPWTSLGDFRPLDPLTDGLCEKNPVGAHGYSAYQLLDTLGRPNPPDLPNEKLKTK